MEHDLTDSVFDEFSAGEDIDLTVPPRPAAQEPAVSMDDLDLADVEREICRLPDVSIARIVADRERPSHRGPRRRPARETTEADRPRRAVDRPGVASASSSIAAS